MARQRADERRGPDRSPSEPREAHDPGSTRHGTTSGSGSNEPKHNERKEEHGFVSRQGGDQTRPGDEAAGGGPSGDEDAGSGPAFEPER